MSDTDELPMARSRPRRAIGWIWVVPLIATGIVIWLAVRALADRGPLVVIEFGSAEGLQAGDTKIKHRDVDIGTVETISLSSDLSHVVVTARMRRSATRWLTSSTRFWVVRPRVGVGGISGLSTLVSGAYIEMYPGTGEAAQRSFSGLDNPPIPAPGTTGRSYTLLTSDLGSLTAGSPISFRGLAVGQVQSYKLDAAGKQIRVQFFVQSPYDALITPVTRFWNSGGIDVAVGLQGVRFRASSWQQLISGGVSFETHDSPMGAVASPAGSEFYLYDNQDTALRDPRNAVLRYRADFPAGGDVATNTDVQLEGSQVGIVKQSSLHYDESRHTLVTQVLFEIDPALVQLAAGGGSSTPATAAQLGQRIEAMVAKGLRARLTSANFITGTKVVSLDLMPDAPRARITRIDNTLVLPTASSSDLTQLLATAQSVLHHIDVATAGPELGHAIKELDRTLSNLDQITSEAEPQLKPLLTSLRAAADAAQRTLEAANSVLGTSAASGEDLPRLIREVSEAARSIRDLTDYLDRHPESLLRGRKADNP